MRLIDFDAEFTRYLTEWAEENRDSYAHADDMEKDLPSVYDAFLDTPAAWLDGQAPGDYFGAYTNAEELCGILSEYVAANIGVPDMLLSRIADLGQASEKPLYACVQDTYRPREERMLAISLLRDIGSFAPLKLFVRWQVTHEEDDELCDNAIESLEEMGDAAVPDMLLALEDADDAAQEALLSVLSRHPGDERIYHGLIRLFGLHPERRAILAAYLGRLGDDRALPILMEAAASEETGYLDFIELRSAIEGLGGEAPMHEFGEDPDYNALFGTEE